jgi:hypothetical protein
MCIILFLLLFCTFQATAQTAVPFNSPRWKFKTGAPVQETHLGKPAIKLVRNMALLEDADFRNGIIEFDIALAKDRYFPAINFRMQDSANYEHYYVRPHQSGNPDAMQYSPVYNGMAGWQLYHGPGYSNARALPFDRWLHIKMLVHERQAEVYFDNDAEPVLFIRRLKRDAASGMIALVNDAPVPAWYANFAYTNTDKVNIKSQVKPFPPLPAAAITSWLVSTPFSEQQVNDKVRLTTADTAALSWQPLQADSLGITDLAMLWPVTEQANTVFARMVIPADKAVTRKLTFGCSDRARVYLNGQLLYAGEDDFMSRDYRFLGTVGLFDALYLPLQAGRNELWIAVSEDFGGWGIKAKLE